MAERSWCAADFELLGQCGAGKVARVFKARERRSGRVVALKVVRRKPLDDFGFHHQARREVEIQYHLNHRHILKLFGYFYDAQQLYLVLEFAPGGSLFALLGEGGALPPPRARRALRQVALALHYMHLRSVIHRDLKLENVLLDARGDVKIADFGWAVHCPEQAQRETYCGTVLYLSPEMAAPGRGHSQSVDVWALGVLAYELHFARPPFAGADKAATLEKIRAEAVAFPPDAPAALRALVAGCLCKDPAQRLTAQQVLEHVYLRAEPV